MEKWTPLERLDYLYAYCKFDQKPMILDFWQDDFIKSCAQFIAIVKSRRTGFSFATALKGVSKAMDPSRTKYVKQFVSYNESDAIEKINYAREFYESIPTKNKKKIVTANKTELEFQDYGGRTTSRLISMPCRPPRGKGGDISLDEFGIFLPRASKQIYQAALFVIARGGCIEVGSTPLGCIGQFYEIITNKEKFPGYARFNVPWWYANALCTDVETAVQEAGNYNTVERVEKWGSDTLKEIFRNAVLEDFQQECECRFIDESESYISLDLILSCTPGMMDDDINIETKRYYTDDELGKELVSYKTIDECILQYDPEVHGQLYLGYDVARKRDAVSMFLIGQLPNGNKRVVGYEEMRNKDFDYQLDMVRKINKSLPIIRQVIDGTGMGAPIAERLTKEFPERTESIEFNISSKETLAMGVKIELQRKGILLPNDKNLHHQIHSIRRIATTGGHFRYDAARDENGHADSFWALAMAMYAASTVQEIRERKSFYTQYGVKKGKIVEAIPEPEKKEIQKKKNIVESPELRRIRRMIHGR